MSEELDSLSKAAKEIAKAYQNSPEYQNLARIVEAIQNDEECQKILEELKDLQRQCRSYDTGLYEKRVLVKKINELKDHLHSLPLWVNYLSAKSDYEALTKRIRETLENN